MIAAIKDLLSVSSRVGSEFTECRMQSALWSHILYTVSCEVWYAMGYALPYSDKYGPRLFEHPLGAVLGSGSGSSEARKPGSPGEQRYMLLRPKTRSEQLPNKLSFWVCVLDFVRCGVPINVRSGEGMRTY